MRPESFCRSCFASLLKFLIFLQGFVGLSIVVYSVWVLDYWQRHHHGVGDSFGLDLGNLTPTWFGYLLLGIGALTCLISFIGYVAAEAVNGCCLCFYALLATIFIFLEAFVVGYLSFYKHWEEDLPNDPTGELRRFRAFIEANVDIFKWGGLAVVVIQVVSILLAIVLRAMIPTRTEDFDSDGDFTFVRKPLLIPQQCPASVLTSAEGSGFHSDVWSARMRQKYGLNQGEFLYNAVDPYIVTAPKTLPSMIVDDEERRMCSIL